MGMAWELLMLMLMGAIFDHLERWNGYHREHGYVVMRGNGHGTGVLGKLTGTQGGKRIHFFSWVGDVVVCLCYQFRWNAGFRGGGRGVRSVPSARTQWLGAGTHPGIVGSLRGLDPIPFPRANHLFTGALLPQKPDWGGRFPDPTQQHSTALHLVKQQKLRLGNGNQYFIFFNFLISAQA